MPALFTMNQTINRPIETVFAAATRRDEFPP